MEKGGCSFFIKIPVPGNYEEETTEQVNARHPLAAILPVRVAPSLALSVQPLILPGILLPGPRAPGTEVRPARFFGFSEDVLGVRLRACPEQR